MSTTSTHGTKIALLAQEAVTLLAALRVRPRDYPPLPELFAEVPGVCRYGKRQFATGAAIHPKWLDLRPECAVEVFLGAMVQNLAGKIPSGLKLGPDALELPIGVEAALARYEGVALRAILSEQINKTGEEIPWTKTGRIYDITLDEFVTGPVMLILRFDVCEPFDLPPAYQAPSFRGIALSRALRRT